ncbi:MAG: hypothetical protein Salg2KO_20050 [Salibacteraceae bacterium]
MSAKIYILTGPVHTGKSRGLLKFLETKNREDLSIRGIINPDINGKKWFINAHSRERYEMDAQEQDTDVILVGKYRFSKQAFDRAKNTLIVQSALPSTWFIIDEIGKLELKGNGLEPEASQALEQAKMQSNNVLLVIRDYLLDDAISDYKLEGAQIITVDQLNEI